MAQFQVECVESTTEADYSQYSRFVLEPLDRGQGTTVGNALRRVLLSNLQGAAVTAVRIAGVNHEVCPGKTGTVFLLDGPKQAAGFIEVSVVRPAV